MGPPHQTLASSDGAQHVRPIVGSSVHLLACSQTPPDAGISPPRKFRVLPAHAPLPDDAQHARLGLMLGWWTASRCTVLNSGLLC